jgi:hypothetical protein
MASFERTVTSSSCLELDCTALSVGLLVALSGDVSGLLGGVPKGEFGRSLPLAGSFGGDNARVLEVFEKSLAGIFGFAARFTGGGAGRTPASLLGDGTTSLLNANDVFRSRAWTEALIRLSMPDVAILRGNTPGPAIGDPFAGSGVMDRVLLPPALGRKSTEKLL